MGIDAISAGGVCAPADSGEVDEAAPADVAVDVAVPDAPPAIADAFSAAPDVLVAGLTADVAAPAPDPDIATTRIGPGGTLTLPTALVSVDGTGQTIDQSVSATATTTIDVEGKNNTVDYASDPPVSGAQANAILGGSHNTGEVDIQGTVIVKAGDHNSWDLNAGGASTDDKTAPKLVVLEGSWSDWSLKMNDDNSRTYTNTTSGTTVDVPSNVQVQATPSTDALETMVKSNPATNPTKVFEAAGFTLPTGEVKQFLDWQRVQPDPLTGQLIGDEWKKGGVNPYLSSTLIQSAQDQIVRQQALEAQAAKNGKKIDTAAWLKPGATIAKPRPVVTPQPPSKAVFGGTATSPFTVGGGVPAGASAPSTSTPAAAKPSALETAADALLAREYPNLTPDARAKLRKLLLSMMRQMSRFSANDMKNFAESKPIKKAAAAVALQN